MAASVTVTVTVTVADMNAQGPLPEQLATAGARRRQARRIRGAIVIAVPLVAGGIFVANEVAVKLVDLRYRLQLVEARQDALARVEAADAKREQMRRGPARLAGNASFSLGQGTWEPFANADLVPGWPEDFERSKALGVHGDHLYAGLSRPGAAAPQVWRSDGRRWEIVGREDFIPAWSGHKQVTALASTGTALFAAIDDTVWAYQPSRRWHCIGGAGAFGSWPAGAYANAYALAAHDGTLFVGMHGGDAAVYAYTGGRWEKIAGSGLRGSWSNARYRGVYELWVHTDGRLYAGLVANPGPTAVYRYDGARWEKVGGDGINGSWTYPGLTYAFSFASVGGQLVVSMNRMPMVHDDFSSIWAFDGRGWNPVGLGHIPALWGAMQSYNAVASYRGLLLIGAGGIPAGNASLWTVRDGRPEMIAGHGINGSWGKRERGIADWLDPGNNEYVYRILEWRGDLIVGFGDDPGMAQLWRFRPAAARR